MIEQKRYFFNGITTKHLLHIHASVRLKRHKVNNVRPHVYIKNLGDISYGERAHISMAFF